MTLKDLICTKAYDLVQFLEHCDDMVFVDKIVCAVANCDYVTIEECRESEYENEQM